VNDFLLRCWLAFVSESVSIGISVRDHSDFSLIGRWCRLIGTRASRWNVGICNFGCAAADQSAGGGAPTHTTTEDTIIVGLPPVERLVGMHEVETGTEIKRPVTNLEPANLNYN
jgi:hypothetical protein